MQTLNAAESVARLTTENTQQIYTNQHSLDIDDTVARQLRTGNIVLSQEIVENIQKEEVMPEPMTVITTKKVDDFQDQDDNSAVLRIKNKSRFDVVPITEESVNYSTNHRVTPINMPIRIMTDNSQLLGEPSNSSGNNPSGKHTVLSKRDSKKTLAIKEEPSQNEEEGDKEI